MQRILIYEPNETLAQRYQDAFKGALWCLVEKSQDGAFEVLRKQPFHVCLWNIETMDDLKSLSQVRHERPAMAIIATSSNTKAEFIVACIHAGASQFWMSQGDCNELAKTVMDTLSRTVPASLSEEQIDFPIPEFVGKHPKILEIFQLILSIKDTDSTVLITGESGTGKEVVARAIHELSLRRRQGLVAVNCGAIPPTLLESELFGHVKGAFTGAIQNRTGRFQMAGNGTLFLDEISDLPFDLQAKLLRAIQNRTFEPVGSPHSLNLEARIIAATNQDLEKAVAEKRFREDLYYRLNVIPVFLPPLRARKSDIPLLVKVFLDKFSKMYSRQVAGISEDAMRLLMQYQWPGNIRELENLIERVVVLKREPGYIEIKDLPVAHFKQVRLDRYVANVALPEEGVDLNEAVNEFENELILQALQKTAGNKNKAATLLNLNRTTLVEKLKRKGLRIAS